MENLGKIRFIILLFVTALMVTSCKKNKVEKPVAAKATVQKVDTTIHKTGYKEDTSYMTHNVSKGRNGVDGIILHHTASPNLSYVLKTFHMKRSGKSSHVVIAKDGTRYIIASPRAITWHAGPSIMKGREHCNQFTVGIEFDGNTCEEPLTTQQIYSAIEYILPLMDKYHIDINDITTHKRVRKAWMKKHPKKSCLWKHYPPKKEDITTKEYNRFIDSLKVALKEK